MNAQTGSGGRRPHGPARRMPVQQRSQERYERLLDACAGLLDEAGPAALTTKEVAQRAHVPIGTLYQFFSGKESLFSALAERNLTHYLDRLAVHLDAAAPVGVPAFVELAVEEFVAMKRDVPGFGQIDFGLVTAAPAVLDDRPDAPPGEEHGEEPREEPDGLHLLDRRLDNNAAVAVRISALGGDLFARPGWGLALRVALESADAVLKLAFRADPAGDPALIAECKRLLCGYLAEHPAS
ncbi:TetR family transcriptional regulator [Kitasatospora sp. NBC_01539]|uniref:TetR family transcriptional regulator n=1 Tax=Kitasatospora sp. NBC_01539 TaxID=2903577 RepID=UPI0038600B31